VLQGKVNSKFTAENVFTIEQTKLSAEDVCSTLEVRMKQSLGVIEKTSKASGA